MNPREKKRQALMRESEALTDFSVGKKKGKTEASGTVPKKRTAHPDARHSVKSASSNAASAERERRGLDGKPSEGKARGAHALSVQDDASSRLKEMRSSHVARRALQLCCGFLVALVVSAALGVGIDVFLHGIFGPNSAGTDHNKYWVGFFFCCSFLICSFVLLWKEFSDKPEIPYLLIALVTSCFFAWSLSTWQVSWDDQAFYKVAATYASEDDSYAFTKMEWHLANSLDPVQQESPKLIEDRSLDVTYQREGALDADSPEVFGVMKKQYFPILPNLPFVPAALVMALCKWASLSVSTTFVLAKFPGAIIYSLLTFFGMRKLKAGKALYAAICLLPTSLFLAANYSYSYWTYGFILFGIAYLASMLQSKCKVRPLDLILMLGALCVACLPRLAYFPLILMGALLPRSCFATKRGLIIYRSVMVLPCILTAAIFFVPIIIHGFGDGDARGGSDIDLARQVDFILSNPLEYLRTLGGFLFGPFQMENGNPDTEVSYVISGYLTPQAARGYLLNYGYLPRPSWLFVLITGMVILFAAFTDKDQERAYGPLPGILAWVLSAIVVILVVTYLYMAFNPVGSDMIRGIQRRYILPCLYPVCAFIGFKRFNLNNAKIPKGVYNCVILGIMTFVLWGSWWQVYISGLN